MNIAPYITEQEYACRCCGKIPPFILKKIYQDLFYCFARIREQVGPLTINSGYRCPKHNTDVGGKEYSIHIFGLALDIATDEPDELFSLIDNLYPDLRIGQYNTFIHIDNGYDIVPRMKSAWRKGARW